MPSAVVVALFATEPRRQRASRPPRPRPGTSSSAPSVATEAAALEEDLSPWWWTHRPAPSAAIGEPFEHDSRSASGAGGRPAGGQPCLPPGGMAGAARRFRRKQDGGRRQRLMARRTNGWATIIAGSPTGRAAAPIGGRHQLRDCPCEVTDLHRAFPIAGPSERRYRGSAACWRPSDDDPGGTPAVVVVSHRASTVALRPRPGSRREHRAPRTAGDPVRTVVRPKDRRPRPKRWADAVDQLRTLQAEYEAWRDQLPESLADSRTAEFLEGVCDVDLDALDVELPRGFGR